MKRFVFYCLYFSDIMACPNMRKESCAARIARLMLEQFMLANEL